MTWYAYAIVIYLSIASLLDVCFVGRSVKITGVSAAFTVMTNIMIIISIFSLVAIHG
jgi:hypothetical protein